MNEDLLHYIWKYQRFSLPLKTTEGEDLQIIHQGVQNMNSGPDFSEASIVIAAIHWVGNIEIHVRSSDWLHHHHEEDRAYANVILHVVWIHDQEIKIGSERLPTLVLKDLVSPTFLEEYEHFISIPHKIPCHSQLTSFPPIHFLSLLEKMAVERLDAKSTRIFDWLQQNEGDWEETLYQNLAYNFGFATNSGTFYELACSLPFRILDKYSDDIQQLEALLFGQASFLDDPADEYQEMLKKEYDFLAAKHSLRKRINRTSWKFSKLRPANFPAVRISQFAGLLHYNHHLFSTLVHPGVTSKAIGKLKIETSEYWQKHYDFGKKRKTKTRVGISTRSNLLINTIAPLLFAYGRKIDSSLHIDRALELLQSMKPENNWIIKEWSKLGKQPENAFDSQALIQLYKLYCAHKKCLSCDIGIKLLA